MLRTVPDGLQKKQASKLQITFLLTAEDSLKYHFNVLLQGHSCLPYIHVTPVLNVTLILLHLMSVRTHTRPTQHGVHILTETERGTHTEQINTEQS
jgi:hypothetical protein